MWLLSILPYWFFYTLLSLSVILLVGASVIKIPRIQSLAIVLIVVSTWFVGGIENNKAWEARVVEMEAKVALAEKASAKANTKITQKIITKIKLVKDTTKANKEYVIQYVAKDLDADCRLTNSSVLLHNSASQNEVSKSPRDPVKGTSDVKASELLGVVTENYGTYYEVVEQVKGWQSWYLQQRKIFEE